MLVEDDTSLMLDLAGGHDLTVKMHQAGKDPLDIRNIFITHFDSDHILGLFPLMRYFSSLPATALQANILRERSPLKRQGDLNAYE